MFALTYFRTLPLIEFSSGFVCVGIKPMAMETYVLFKKLVRKFSEGITFQISTFGKRAHPQDIRSGKVRWRGFLILFIRLFKTVFFLFVKALSICFFSLKTSFPFSQKKRCHFYFFHSPRKKGKYPITTPKPCEKFKT